MATRNRDPQRKIKRVQSAKRVQSKELPTRFWANAVAMLAEKKPVVPERESQLSVNVSTRDFDIIHLRRLASWI